MKADLSLYRVFVAVADEGSFVRAAARLFLTQPAVSQAVQRMEMQTGAKLFIRGRRGVRLTREGELLYRHASAALAMLEAGEQQLARVQNLEAGTLRLGAADTITKEFLLPFLSAFRTLHPGVQLQVTNRTSVQLVQKVLDGRLDMAVVNLPVENERLCVRPILQVHDIFVAGHAFAHLKGKTLSPAELAAQPLAMLEQAANSRRYVDSFFARCGVQLSPQIELGAHGLLPGLCRYRLRAGVRGAGVLRQRAGGRHGVPCAAAPSHTAARSGRLLALRYGAFRRGKGVFAPSGGRCAPCAADVTHFTLRQVCRSHRAIGLDSALGPAL